MHCRGIFGCKASEPGQDRKVAALRIRFVAKEPLRLFFMKWLLFLIYLTPLAAETSVEETFTNVYKNCIWGVNENGEGFSGDGSRVENAIPYMLFLQNFLKTHQIKSVVDVGCGDWTFSRYLEWNDAKYIGIDVVKSVIEKNTRQFASDQISFIHASGTTYDLPKADLLICKDVLQHLSNDEIFAFIHQIGKFKHCLITNDIDLNGPNNQDISTGGWRKIDLFSSPFYLDGKVALEYKNPGLTKRVVHIEK